MSIFVYFFILFFKTMFVLGVNIIFEKLEMNKKIIGFLEMPKGFGNISKILKF